MTPVESSEEALHRLRTILTEERLSEKLHQSCQRLAKRLSSPIRITLLGPPGGGKTTLLNSLSDEPMLPINAGLPSYEVLYSETPFAIATRSDGTTARFTEVDFAMISAEAPVFVQIYLPDDVLRHIRIMEVVTDGSQFEMRAASRWAAKRTDVAIWCSNEFTEAEHALWSMLPDKIKDHGFLMLGHPSMYEAVSRVAAEDFHHIAPVEKVRAFEALRMQGDQRQGEIVASGIGALRAEILRHIDLARQADIDQAILFISRFAKPTKAQTGEPRPISPGLEHLGQITRQPQPLGGQTHSPAFVEGADFLRQQANVMLTDIEEFGSDASRVLLDRCLEVANHLVDMVADRAPATEQEALAADAAIEAADTLLLMTLEPDHDAAEDAVSLLLQVRRDFEFAAAA